MKYLKHIPQVLITIVTIQLISCSKEVPAIALPFPEYVEWIKNYHNGLRQEKNFGSVIITVQYLPTEYLVYKETLLNNGLNYDSLLKKFDNQLTYMLTIQDTSVTKSKIDLLALNVVNYEEFSQKVIEANFHLNDQFTIEDSACKTIAPILAHLENDYGINGKRSFIVVFPNKMKTMKKFKFKWVDRLFNTGIQIFNFDLSNLQQAPKIIRNK